MALGLLRQGFCGAHAVWLTNKDIELLSEAHAGISHNPVSNLYLGSGVARIPDLLRSGVAIGIGTDGPNCCSNTSLFEVMKLASILHRVYEVNSEQWISALDAFRMATIGGARALGLDKEIGSIEVGKKADMVLLKADTPNFIPLNDPVMQIVYGETGSNVETVIVDGEVVFSDGESTRFDSSAVLAEAKELGSMLRERSRSGLANAYALKPYLQEAYLALTREFDTLSKSRFE
jgi:cytosine/adenosine deaminase-related metal-dependent hydrolase